MEEIKKLLEKLGLDYDKLEKGELTADAAFADVTTRVVESKKGEIEKAAAQKASKGAYTKAEKAILLRFGVDEKALEGVDENERIEKLLEVAESGYKEKLKELEAKAASGDESSKLQLEITQLRDNLTNAGKEIQNLKLQQKKIEEDTKAEKNRFIEQHYIETNFTKTLFDISGKLMGGAAHVPVLESFVKRRMEQDGYQFKADKDKLELLNKDGLPVYDGTIMVTPAVYAERIANEAKLIPQSNGAPNGGGNGTPVKFSEDTAAALSPAFLKAVGG